MPGLDLEVVGTPTFDTSAPKFGSAALTPNSTSYGRTPSCALPAVPFTIEGWVRRSAGANTRVAAGKVNAFWMGTNSGNANVAVARYGSGGTEVSLLHTANISDGNWHHLALVITETGGTLYADGVSVPGSTSSVTPTAANMILTGGAVNFETLLGIGNFGSSSNIPWQDGSLDDFALHNYAKYTGNFTPPTAPVDPAASGLVALWNFDGSLMANKATTRTTIAPNDAGIFYSPYNWVPATGSLVSTINPGAYLKTVIRGSSLKILFDISGYPTGGTTGSFYPQMTAVVDGNFAYSFVVNASSIEIPLPSELLHFQQEHYVELWVKATTQTLARWSAQTSTIVKITGFQVDTGRSVKAPAVFDKNILVFGDSIFEGINTRRSITVNNNDVDRNDIAQTAIWQTCRKLGAEFGIVAFGGTGINQAASTTNVPNLQNAYNLIMSGVTRSFTPAPDLIILNQGQNDSIGTPSVFINGAIAALNLLLTAAPATKILTWCTRTVCNPYWLTAANGCKNPGAVTIGDTEALLVYVPANTSDGVHPYGNENMQNSHPKLLNIARKLLQPPAVRSRPMAWF